MPRVQFVRPMSGINITKTIPHAQSSKMSKWISLSRKAIPEIPELKGSGTEWSVVREITETRIIILELMNSVTLERASLAIDRK